MAVIDSDEQHNADLLSINEGLMYYVLDMITRERTFMAIPIEPNLRNFHVSVHAIATYLRTRASRNDKLNRNLKRMEVELGSIMPHHLEYFPILQQYKRMLIDHIAERHLFDKYYEAPEKKKGKSSIAMEMIK